MQSERWIWHLMQAHIATAAVSGLLAVLTPSVWHVFFTLDLQGDERLLLNIVIQLYGALLVGQAVLVFSLRSHLFTRQGQSAAFSRQLRLGVCTAYTLVFSLSFALVLRAQIAGVMNLAASVNSLLFLSMASAYALLAMRSTHRLPKRLKL